MKRLSGNGHTEWITTIALQKYANLIARCFIKQDVEIEIPFAIRFASEVFFSSLSY